MWRVFEADSGNQLLADITGALSTGAVGDIRCSRAGDTREILHAALTLRNPRARWATTRRPALNIAFALAEVVWILSGRSDARFLTYFNRSLSRFTGDGIVLHGAYGGRLRRHFGMDQLQQAYDALRTNPESRQIVLQIWDAGVDLPGSDGRPRNPDIPCNTQSILKVRNGRLEWLQIMRSNDVFLGLPYNLVQFTFLQEVMAGWLGIEPGHYHHISDSLHLYERDASKIKQNSDAQTLPYERFSLPKLGSDRAIAALAAAVDQIIDEKCPTETVAALPERSDLPSPYINMLRVLTAEGLRRRGRSECGDKIMDSCDSPTFCLMWANWLDRVKSNQRQH